MRRFDVVRTDRLLMRRWRAEDREPFAAMNADPEVMRDFPAPLDRAASDALMDRIEDLFQRQGFGLWALEVAAPEPARTEPARTEPARTEPARAAPARAAPARAAPARAAPARAAPARAAPARAAPASAGPASVGLTNAGLPGTEPPGTGLPGPGEFIGFTGLNPMPAGVPGAGGMEVGWRLARAAWHHGYATEAATAAAGVAFGGAGLPELWSITAVVNEPSQAVMRRLGMTPHARFDHPGVGSGHPLRPHIAYHLTRSQPA